MLDYPRQDLQGLGHFMKDFMEVFGIDWEDLGLELDLGSRTSDCIRLWIRLWTMLSCVCSAVRTKFQRCLFVGFYNPLRSCCVMDYRRCLQG